MAETLAAIGIGSGTTTTVVAPVAAGGYGATSLSGVAVQGSLIGAGSTVSTATAGLTAGEMAAMGSLALSGVAMANAGEAAKHQYEMQADRERRASQIREVQRKTRLLSALASQNASRAARGIRSYEGSPAAMMKTDLENYYLDREVDAGATSGRQAQFGASGRAARDTGYISAGASLFDAGSRQLNRG